MACLLEGVGRRVRGGIGGLERLHGGCGGRRVEGVKEEHGREISGIQKPNFKAEYLPHSYD